MSPSVWEPCPGSCFLLFLVRFVDLLPATFPPASAHMFSTPVEKSPGTSAGPVPPRCNIDFKVCIIGTHSRQVVVDLRQVICQVTPTIRKQLVMAMESNRVTTATMMTRRSNLQQVQTRLSLRMRMRFGLKTRLQLRMKMLPKTRLRPMMSLMPRIRQRPQLNLGLQVRLAWW